MADNNFEYSMKDNLSNAWKENPGFRIMTIVVILVVVLAIGVSSANIRKVKTDTVSTLRNTRGVVDEPFEEKSESYKVALENDEEKRLEAAVQKGKSVLPYTGTFDNKEIKNYVEESEAESFFGLDDLEKLDFGSKNKKDEDSGSSADESESLVDDASDILEGLLGGGKKKGPCNPNKNQNKTKSGFNRNGINAEGYDKDGYLRDCLTEADFDKDGYAADGFDKFGYDRKGFDKEGYNKMGYNKEGFDKDGYDKNGYDKDGFNKQGIDKEGYNKKGLNSEGKNRAGTYRDGLTESDFGPDGYAADGFDKFGYNKEGYDKDGLDREGYDKDGFNKEGFNRNGVNRQGLTKEGTYRDGLTEADFDKDGYAADGFDKFGYDKNGFDKNGFDKNGYNKEGYNRQGLDKKGKKKGRDILKELGYTAEQKKSLAELKIDSMSNQINSLVNVAEPVYKTFQITDLSLASAGGSSSAGSFDDSGDLLDSDELLSSLEKQELVVSAGTVSYAVFLTESNSDVPGPVLAKVLTGPLKNFKILGAFTVQDDYLTIQFNTAVLGHEEYEIEAFALDPSTTLPGLSDDIDRHYISRYVLPMAASFVEVLGDALGETEETQSTSDGVTTKTSEKKSTSDSLWEAAGESSKTIGEILKENIDKDPTIRVFAGTEAGILFTKTVKGEESVKR
ncbi:MAG: hypothetical protein N4A43_01225 [Alphaproteobacteria bacterium]|jgi:hypothetical protein|nr:hypothetical protein [Alphaproteobacteria bacterium]